jgi:NhaP-type Na+/H+ or K+/H+ antiporter/rhodanese-related sulfurtransferase
MSELVIGFALAAIVLTVSALASGFVERAPLSFPMIFLGLGLLLGDGGFGVLTIDTHNPVLEAVAVVSLALVLFLDAVNMQVDEIRRDWLIPFLSLGPGTLLTIAGVAGAAGLLLGVGPLQAVLLGAILASTDPVVLRDVVRDVRIPRSIRQALGVEAGMNDIVVLPIVLVLIAVLRADIGGTLEWVFFLAKLLLLSPLVGLFVGGIGAYLMGRIDAKFNIRREYQALYGIGLVLAAYSVGQIVQGDGFLAAFFAGLAVTLFNVSLCDCFLEYGEVTAEMAMLLAFILFGAVLSTLLGTIPLVPALILALTAIVIVRPLAFGLVLQRAAMSNLARGFIGWFGPRGLNSLLLALLAVQAGVNQADWLLGIVGMVVLVSVIAHGATATPLSGWYARRIARAIPTLVEEREGSAVGLFQQGAQEVPQITPAELAAALASEAPPIVLDVRTRARYVQDAGQIPGSIRVLPDQIEMWVGDADRSRPIVVYCTCPDDATSIRVARQLLDRGFNAVSLEGGYAAWSASYPVEPKGVAEQLPVRKQPVELTIPLIESDPDQQAQ